MKYVTRIEDVRPNNIGLLVPHTARLFLVTNVHGHIQGMGIRNIWNIPYRTKRSRLKRIL